MDVLKWISQDKRLFSFPQEQDRIMGGQSEKTEQALEQLRQTLNAGQKAQLNAYLEQMEQLQGMEQRLAYENGFLFAYSLWLQIWGRLRGEEL
ncbi:DUF6809 family protein [Oscillospiraceae bacterium 50-16]